MRYEKLIRTGSDPVLKAVCEPVKPGECISDLIEIMTFVCRKGKGIGLAAPQVGVTKRVVMTRGTGSGPVVSRFYINPEIINMSTTSTVAEEGCLSYPRTGRKLIRRYDWIHIQYLDIKRQPKDMRFEGWEARVLQHEIDHLDGICKVGDPHYVPRPLP